MNKPKVWLLKYFPYSMLVRNQSRFLRLGAVIFIGAMTLEIYSHEEYDNLVVSFSGLAFVLLFISSFLPRKETKVSSLVTQTGALELIDLCPLPVFTYEKRKDDIYVRFANSACHHTFSLGAKSLIGKPIANFVMLEDEDELLTACFETLEAKDMGSNKTFFFRTRNSTGDIVKMMCSTAKIEWLGQHIGICFIFDISESDNQSIQMQAHANEGYKSALVSGIVHDFRNVLTSIIGTAEALQFTLKDKQTIKQLDLIIDAGERGASTITDILKLSSSSQNNAKSEFRDIANDIKSILSLLRLQLPAKVNLKHYIQKQIPKTNVSISQLEQILMNLVNNATQAMDKEKGNIEIHIKESNSSEEPTRKFLLISVSDNGKGISKEDLPFVTENFFSLRKDSGGTGLGLAMVKRIVKNNGGNFKITSEIGVGTKIDMLFPSNDKKTNERTKNTTIEAEVTREIKTRQEQTAVPSSPIQPKSSVILLVDDQPSVLNIHQMLLEAMGHEVITSLSGEDAINIYQREQTRIQMVVTDFNMPDLDGIDLVKRLREINSELPALMITGFGNTEKLSLAADLNMSLILKPTNLKKFEDAIMDTQIKYPKLFS